LYMNICQHSTENKGYIFISEPDESGEILLSFSDLGVGIVQNLRSFDFPKTTSMSDAEVIEYATQDFVTTKSGIQNQGRGLHTLLTGVRAMNGKTQIFCEKGHFIVEMNQTSHLSLNYEHKGTFIVVKFNIHELEPKSDDDYSSDIDF
jgi:hypothetical protein